MLPKLEDFLSHWVHALIEGLPAPLLLCRLFHLLHYPSEQSPLLDLQIPIGLRSEMVRTTEFAVRQHHALILSLLAMDGGAILISPVSGCVLARC